jgi:hypothetical protein
MASRPTKYAHVVGTLPKFLGIEPERRDLVEQVKAEILAAPAETTFNVGAQIASLMDRMSLLVENAIALTKLIAAGHSTASAFAQGYADVRLIKDRVADWQSSVQLLLDAYEQLMIDAMKQEKLASLRMASGASVSVYDEPIGQVIDKEAFRQWCVAPSEICMECGGPEGALAHQEELNDPREQLVTRHSFKPGGGMERQLQLWPSTMNAITKERLLGGEPPPDGVEAFAKTMVRLNKA